MSDLYRELILDHWRNPRHAAPLTKPTVIGEIANESCGDSARVELLFDDDVIRDVSIQISGCALATAAGSILAERITGQPLSVTTNIDEAMMLSWLGGIDPATSRRRCATLALEAVRTILAAYPIPFETPSVEG